MIRKVTMRHKDGRTFVVETAMDDRFLERMYPGWKVQTARIDLDKLTVEQCEQADLEISGEV